MHILSRGAKNQEISDVELLEEKQEQKRRHASYDLPAVFAKALLVFLLVYGTVGGFLSAYDIHFDRMLCALVILILAFILCAVYETGIKWAANITNIGILLLYLFVAIRNFWLINSGYYCILNKIYETARNYFEIASGIEYVIAVQDEYRAVTAFVLFVGMVGTILFCIQLQRKAGFFRAFILTMLLYMIPFYFEKEPDLIYILFLCIGYVTLAALHCGNIKKHIAAQVKSLLPLSAALAVILISVMGFLMPQSRYQYIVPQSQIKEMTHNGMSDFAQFGFMAFFRNVYGGAGMSAGALGKSAVIMPDYETDLKVRYTPYSYEPVYLKAFTGLDYLGDRWSDAEKQDLKNVGQDAETDKRISDYETDRQKQSRGIMEVEVADVSLQRYDFKPYYTDDKTVHESKDTRVYTYYPPVFETQVPDSAVDERYLQVPDSCIRAVRNVCRQAGFSGSPEEVAAQLVKYFDDHYSYTLHPGLYFGSSDYITHFLDESKKGYCAHFASAGTMLFRYMGIPARYVEGYAFSYNDILVDGELKEEARYDDYYDGYAPLGETGLVELEVSDANAHAWIEIYIKGKGWVVIDPTPAMDSEDDDMSFWEAFMDEEGDGEGGTANSAINNLGKVLEQAMAPLASVVLAVILVLLVILCTRMIVRRRQLMKLSKRERIQFEYGLMVRYLSKKSKEFAAISTIEEQVGWMERHCGMVLTKEQRIAIYEVFFAQEAPPDLDGLYECVVKMRRKLRFCKI